MQKCINAIESAKQSAKNNKAPLIFAKLVCSILVMIPVSPILNVKAGDSTTNPACIASSIIAAVTTILNAPILYLNNASSSLPGESNCKKNIKNVALATDTVVNALFISVMMYAQPVNNKSVPTEKLMAVLALYLFGIFSISCDTEDNSHDTGNAAPRRPLEQTLLGQGHGHGQGQDDIATITKEELKYKFSSRQNAFDIEQI